MYISASMKRNCIAALCIVTVMLAASTESYAWSDCCWEGVYGDPTCEETDCFFVCHGMDYVEDRIAIVRCYTGNPEWPWIDFPYTIKWVHCDVEAGLCTIPSGDPDPSRNVCVPAECWGGWDAPVPEDCGEQFVIPGWVEAGVWACCYNIDIVQFNNSGWAILKRSAE